MYIIFCGVFLVLACIFHLTRVNPTVKNVLIKVAYEIYYYILGFRGMVEDIAYSDQNKIQLTPKTGEVAVITGGARGIGKEVVQKLLECDIHVVIGCRRVEAGEEAVKKIRSHGIHSGKATVIPLDVGSLRSVKLFATNVLDAVSRIDYLINNAGIMFPPYAETEEGFESQFAVNYLGHCFLTHILLPRMIETANKKGLNTRVVNVSSVGHFAGSINFEDFNMREFYCASAGYAQSKLAQVLFTRSLDSKLKKLGIPVQVHAVHPGLVNTDLFNGTTLKIIAPYAPYLLFKTPEQGARTTVHACLSPAWEGKGGNYISNCRESQPSKTACSKETADKLWEATLSLLKVDKFGGVLE